MQQYHEPHDYSCQGVLPVPAGRQIAVAIDESDRIDKAHRDRVGQQWPREGAPAAPVAGTGRGGGPGVVLAAGPAERLQEEGGGDFNWLSSDNLNDLQNAISTGTTWLCVAALVQAQLATPAAHALALRLQNTWMRQEILLANLLKARAIDTGSLIVVSA